MKLIMTPIEKDAYLVLEKLEDNRQPVTGPQIQELTGLSVDRINDAVDYLKSNEALSTRVYLRCVPFNFSTISVETKGRIMYQKVKEQA